jgi:radical SAM/Cys-rich protein
MKSLRARSEPLSDVAIQLGVLNGNGSAADRIPSFKDKLKAIGFNPLKPTGIDVLQLNVGYVCNQTCSHCHVDAGPDRRESMTRQTMQQCLDALDRTPITTVDITGGAPELNPHFTWLVAELSSRRKHIMVRCNLTVILSNKKYHDLPDFFRSHRVEVVASLPYYSATRTDGQRGEGVFSKSIEALKMLNAVGYATRPELMLNLVYNPSGAFLPGSQKALEADFKRMLRARHNIEFNNLFVITNMPINRFLDYLMRSGNYEAYMHRLVNAFNPEAAAQVMCRNTISVGWDGRLYDCDFNQMLGLEVHSSAPRHIKDFNLEELGRRDIVLNQHCYGCTAGAGSSCGGSIV